MTLTLSNKFLGKVCLWLIISTSFYYPLSVFLNVTASLPSTQVNILIRVSFTFVALLLIAAAFVKKEKPRYFTNAIFFLLLFWFLYSLRIFYDLNRGIRLSIYDNTYIYGFTFGNCLIPILAIIVWGKFVDIDKLTPALFKTFILTNIATLGTLIFYNKGFDFSIFLSRAQINSNLTTGTEDNVILTPITIGYHGAFLVLLSVYYLTLGKSKYALFYVICLLLGLLNLILGASRGPFLNCLVVLIVFLYFQFKVSKSIVFSTVKVIFIVTPIFLGFFYTLSKYISLEDVQLFNRLFSFYENRESNEGEERVYLYQDAWDLFLQSPIIGKQFVTSTAVGNTYPHNIFLELLMSLGLIGASIFFGFFGYVLLYLYQIFKYTKSEYLVLALVFLQIFLGVLFSGTLLMSIEFWLFLTFILVFIPIRKDKLF